MKKVNNQYSIKKSLLHAKNYLSNSYIRKIELYNTTNEFYNITYIDDITNSYIKATYKANKLLNVYIYIGGAYDKESYIYYMA